MNTPFTRTLHAPVTPQVLSPPHTPHCPSPTTSQLIELPSSPRSPGPPARPPPLTNGRRHPASRRLRGAGARGPTCGRSGRRRRRPTPCAAGLAGSCREGRCKSGIGRSWVGSGWDGAGAHDAGGHLADVAESLSAFQRHVSTASAAGGREGGVLRYFPRSPNVDGGSSR